MAMFYSPCRYFSKQELRDLFACEAAQLKDSETQAQLQLLHGADRRYTAEVQSHLDELLAMECVASTSDHMLLFDRDEAVRLTGSEPTPSFFSTHLGAPVPQPSSGVCVCVHAVQQQCFCFNK